MESIITKSLAAVGIAALSVTTVGTAAMATADTNLPARQAYINVMSGIASSVAIDTGAFAKCFVVGPPFKPVDAKCAKAPETIVNMIDLQGVALDRLSNPQSPTYVGPPPADLAQLVNTSHESAKNAYFPVAQAMHDCRSGYCDAAQYGKAVEAARKYSAALAPWLAMEAARAHVQTGRVINGCEIKPGTKCPGVDLSGQDLSDANLSGADLTGANLTGTNFDNAMLNDAILNKVIAINAKFPEARMIGAKLNGAQLGSADFYRTQLGGAILTDADLTRTNFDHTFMNKVALNRTTGSAEIFSSAQMTGVDATGASLTQADFTSANMRGLDYSRNTTVAGSTFNNATCPNGSKASGSPARCSEFGS